MLWGAYQCGIPCLCALSASAFMHSSWGRFLLRNFLWRLNYHNLFKFVCTIPHLELRDKYKNRQRTVLGQRIVLAWISTSTHWHYSCINLTTTTIMENFELVCHTCTPSYYNLAWLWWADSCCFSLQKLVSKSAYTAARVLFNGEDVSSSDQHTIAAVQVVGFVLLTILICKCTNDVT